MAPIQTQWKKLVRFVAVETGQVHIGEPIENIDVGMVSSQGKGFKVHEISGSVTDLNAKVTGKILTVKQLLSPLAREDVKVVRCLGLNYADHAAEAGLQAPPVPVLFYKPVNTLIGPNDPIVIPKVAQPASKHLPDHEVELVIVIGKTAKNVKEDEALDYVLGYTAANDVSFRHHQMTTSQWGFSKGFDNTNPLGPCIVSAEAIGDPQKIQLNCKVNGRILQNGNTSDMIFNIRETISFLSQGTTLEPGTIILTGTPKGVGFVKKPPTYLKDGDTVSIWVGGGIGSLNNKIKECDCFKDHKL